MGNHFVIFCGGGGCGVASTAAVAVAVAVVVATALAIGRRDRRAHSRRSCSGEARETGRMREEGGGWPAGRAAPPMREGKGEWWGSSLPLSLRLARERSRWERRPRSWTRRRDAEGMSAVPGRQHRLS